MTPDELQSILNEYAFTSLVGQGARAIFNHQLHLGLMFCLLEETLVFYYEFYNKENSEESSVDEVPEDFHTKLYRGNNIPNHYGISEPTFSEVTDSLLEVYGLESFRTQSAQSHYSSKLGNKTFVSYIRAANVVGLKSLSDFKDKDDVVNFMNMVKLV